MLKLNPKGWGSKNNFFTIHSLSIILNTFSKTFKDISFDFSYLLAIHWNYSLHLTPKNQGEFRKIVLFITFEPIVNTSLNFVQLVMPFITFMVQGLIMSSFYEVTLWCHHFFNSLVGLYYPKFDEGVSFYAFWNKWSLICWISVQFLM